MRAVLLWLALLSTSQAGWQLARPGWLYEFPRDHGNHPEFKTEWWYFTGNVATADGRAFGYQLTFFRQGVISPEDDRITLSRFVTRDVKLAHFALSDPGAEKFHYFQKVSRGAYSEAGFDQGNRLAWIEDWSCERLGEHAFRLQARGGEVSLDLVVKTAKPPVLHGRDGVSQKAEGEGRASHYYSLTRLVTDGTIRLGKEEFAVSGLSWFDHEWATNQLAAHQEGWDWFSLHFDDGSELMLFQLREKSGGRDVHSAGTFVAPNGRATSIAHADFTLEPGETWISPQTGGRYPTEWRIAIPGLDLRLNLRAVLKDQELRLDPISYWEGAVRAEGTSRGKPVKASGYLEMTGYTGKIVGLQAPPAE